MSIYLLYPFTYLSIKLSIYLSYYVFSYFSINLYVFTLTNEGKREWKKRLDGWMDGWKVKRGEKKACQKNNVRMIYAKHIGKKKIKRISINVK